MKIREAIQIGAIVVLAFLAYGLMQSDDERAAKHEQEVWQGSKVDK